MSSPPCLCSLSVWMAVKCGICGVSDAEVRFDSCIVDDVRLCCVHEMLEFLHSAPYAVCVELKNFVSLCVLFCRSFVCFVCDSGWGVLWWWGCEELGGCCWGGRFCVVWKFV